MYNFEYILLISDKEFTEQTTYPEFEKISKEIIEEITASLLELNLFKENGSVNRYSLRDFL